MTRQCRPRGGAPVGHVGDLGGLEAVALGCLRLWARACTGAGTDKGTVAVRRALAVPLGAEAGGRAAEDFGTLMDLCTRHGRRPLVVHHPDCTCLGADEACLANFIAAATEGEREDAMLLATLIVRPDAAPMLSALARDVGLALRRAARRAASPVAGQGPRPGKVLH